MWYLTSYLLDKQQTKNDKATERYQNYSEQPLQYTFPAHFTGEKPPRPAGKRPIAAVIREKGSNSEREMANALYLAGFDVKDVHTTDLISGRETLEDVQFIDLLFETISAFATVGLSKDLTPHLKDITKVFIIILMFIGRVGPLTIIFSFYNKVNRKKFKYSNGNVIVG